MFLIILLLIPMWFLSISKLRKVQKKKLDLKGKVIAFFHPFCEQGGGGERVLWTAIKAIQTQFKNKTIVIYVWENVLDLKDLKQRIKTQFNITINTSQLVLIPIITWPWLEAKRYPRFTLLAQSLGSMVVGLECMFRLIPDTFIDTTGYPFVYPIVRWMYLCSVIAYVHYPTISTDMLDKVAKQEIDFNNDASFAQSKFKTRIKLWYYRAFSVLYYICGKCVDIVIVNSSWTLGHIQYLWNVNAHLMYPPSDTKEFEKLDLKIKRNMILSVGQFRPEKNHSLQLKAFSYLLETYPSYKANKKNPLQFILIGGVRNESDQAIVDRLLNEIQELKLQEFVKIIPNASHATLKEYYSLSLIGLHTMSNEHFGISIVEYMAAGLIPVAHNSGGPRMDIVKPFQGESTGYLAYTIQEYGDIFNSILSMPSHKRLEIQGRARESVLTRFSNESFQKAFLNDLQFAL